MQMNERFLAAGFIMESRCETLKRLMCLLYAAAVLPSAAEMSVVKAVRTLASAQGGTCYRKASARGRGMKRTIRPLAYCLQHPLLIITITRKRVHYAVLEL